MGEIEYCEEGTTEEELKHKLLKRNQEWQNKKDGVDDYNDSLRTIVLSCVDSRVPVEKIFQARPGEMLVLKNAGNLVREDVLRSMLAAIFEIDARFVIIMGHTNCGMSIKGNKEKEEHVRQDIGNETLKRIEKMAGMDPFEWFGFFEEGTWEENAKAQAEYLKNVLMDLLPEKDMPCILTALYDLKSGRVK